MHKDLLRSMMVKLKRKGAEYADIRWVKTQHENLAVLNHSPENISFHIDEGYGIRVLVSGAWGFSCGSLFEEKEIEKTMARAIRIAKASASVNKEKISFPAYAQEHSVHASSYQINPFEVSQETKLHYLFYANETLLKAPEIKFAQSNLDFYHIHKFFINSEGSQIEQSFIESGAYMEAVACANDEAQKRSYPISHHSQLRQAGYEYIRELNLPGNAARVREEAVMLLKAKEFPAGETTVILDGYQTAMQLHESCGHAAELDRVLGSELSFAGGSFLSLDKRGRFRFGSKIVNISADASLAGGVGSFAYDDEGVKAEKIEIVKNGIFRDYLSSRQSCAYLGRPSNGAMRADSWNHIPLIRMTNINLEPGKPSLSELIADTPDGFFLATNKSWSIDDTRLNFQFGTEIAWRIKRGKLGAVYKNPLYQSNTPYLWNNCSGIANRDSWYIWGIPTCGKGEPVQSIHVGHGTSPARFERINAGVARK